MSRDASIDPNSNLLTIVTPTSSVFAPVLSGTTSLWSGSAQASLSGIYPALPLQHSNHYWQGKFFSNSNTTHTTTDGGAYIGFFGGMSLDGTGVLDTNLSALYVDPTGKAGIMHGTVPGTFSAGTMTGSGTLTLTEMNAGSGLNPATFAANWWNPTTGTTVVGMTGPVIADSNNGSEKNGSEGYLFDAALNLTGVMEQRGDVVQLAYLAADPSFGVWTRESFGAYSGSGTQLVLTTNAEWGTVNPNLSFTVDDYIKIISLGNWQDGALSGRADGVWADLATGSIKVLTGSLTGSSNPGTLTFGAVSTGSFIDLNRFLANPTLAAGLGFPTLLGVDSFALSGTGNTGSVSLGTVNFYSRNPGDPISLWVAQNISGSYTGNLQQQTYTLMNGASPSTSSIMGNMRINGTSTTGNTWLGSINVIGETGLGTSFRSQFDGIAAGSFTGSTFTGSAAGLSHPVTYYSSMSGILKRYTGGLVTSYGAMDGVLGGMTLWSSTPLLASEFQAMGFATPSQALTNTDYVLSTSIRSQDLPSGQAVTADGGAYQGHVVAGISTVGGNPGSPGILGVVNALSVDPSGNAGILHGTVDGFFDPSTKIWIMDGEVFPVTLVANSGVDPTTLSTAVIDRPVAFGTGGTVFSGTTPGLGAWAPETYTRSHIAAYPGWGIGEFPLYVPYSSPPAANAPWGIDFTITDGTIADFKMTGTMAGYRWDTPSGQLGADTRAGWRDMLPANVAAVPTTGIFIGETVGTFNPATLQAMTSGIWLETGTLLNLVQNNPAALEKLKLPAFEVGRASFSGSTADFDVTVNDMIFLAPVNGARPEVFASNNITGNNFTAFPLGTATLTQTAGTASGFAPTFTINKWDTINNKWSATLQTTNSNGAVPGHTGIQFMGTAAGRSNGGVPGTFTGTAAGVVR